MLVDPVYVSWKEDTTGNALADEKFIQSICCAVTNQYVLTEENARLYVFILVYLFTFYKIFCRYKIVTWSQLKSLVTCCSFWSLVIVGLAPCAIFLWGIFLTPQTNDDSSRRSVANISIITQYE